MNGWIVTPSIDARNEKRFTTAQKASTHISIEYQSSDLIVKLAAAYYW